MKLTARRRLVIPAAAAVAVAGAGAALLARHGSAGSEQYRTAVATLGSVTQTISLSGNLAPVGETDLDFGSSGKVVAIDVHPGEAVTAGQALASIDAGALQAALTQAQATLASAQARLSLDQSGPSAQTLAQTQASVRSAQTAVQSAQIALADTQKVDQSSIAQAQSALSAAQAKLGADQASCKAAPAATASPSPSPSASPSPSPSPTPNPACGQIPGDNAAVAAATAGVSGAQAKAQQSEHQAQSQLSSAQVQLQNAQDGLSTQQQGTSTQQVAMDQSQVQVDQVNVNNAQTAVTQATLTAPVAGTVGQVNLALGQTTGGTSAAASSSSSGSGSGSGAAAGGASGSTSTSTSSSASTTHAIVILTPGAFEVVGSVSDVQVNQIAIGQAANVGVAGTSRALTGKVTNIAAVATVSNGVATFPVTVVLDGANQGLHAGVSASIAVVVDQVSNVVTVPTTAIHRAGGASSVQTLVNGAPVTTPVTIGATDALRAQILSGVNPGDTVVIATITSAVPTPNVNSFLGGGGGRGAGGAGGGRRAAGG